MIPDRVKKLVLAYGGNDLFFDIFFKACLNIRIGSCVLERFCDKFFGVLCGSHLVDVFDIYLEHYVLTCEILVIAFGEREVKIDTVVFACLGGDYTDKSLLKAGDKAAGADNKRVGRFIIHVGSAAKCFSVYIALVIDHNGVAFCDCSVGDLVAGAGFIIFTEHIDICINALLTGHKGFGESNGEVLVCGSINRDIFGHVVA